MDLKIDLNGINCNNIYRNLSVPELVTFALKNEEGVLTDTGALVVHTNKYTGRSPKDRFIIKDDITKDLIHWGTINIPLDETVFNKIYLDVLNYLENKDLFIFDGFVGALKEHTLPIRVICENAYQALFSNQIFIRPSNEELDTHKADFTVISVPGYKAKGQADGINSEAFILINFSKKIILIGGTAYSGEIKKSVFSVMNFLLPQKGILPMHCSINKGVDGETTIFFGLSGTGKTTLSTDPERKLIGDDEHGWCDEGVFNFEGGCYAKTINLNKEKEKEIHRAIKFGTVLENVVLNSDGSPDYNDSSLTENTRACYPIEYIENSELSGLGNHPSKIIFLTADAFGVIPPVSKLTKEAAMYHFMSGYTSKVAGTERGITEPEATFSSFFGEPFMILKPEVYTKLLGEKIEKHKTEIYLVNTGWIGGGYGKGKRINLSYTRSMVNAVISSQLDQVEYQQHPNLNVFVPNSCPNVPSDLLNPKNTWDDKNEYELKVTELSKKFIENFKRFKDIPVSIIKEGPKI